jgi:hypothetical protein
MRADVARCLLIAFPLIALSSVDPGRERARKPFKP